MKKGHSFITFAFRGGGGLSKYKCMQLGGGVWLCQCKHFHIYFLIERQVHKLPTITVRVLVKFRKNSFFSKAAGL